MKFGVFMNIDMFIELVVFQSEGIANVFDFLQKNGINYITLSPQYFIETGDTQDLRLPPLDLDGQSRVLERPLFNGKRVQYGKKYFCFQPDETLYQNTTYRPNCKKFDSDFCMEVVQEARRRNIQVSLFMPNVPKNGYQKKDMPISCDGKQITPKISNEACRNVENVINYYAALMKDLYQTYKPDEIMLDWMEFTNYFFSDNLICFCDSCKTKMERYGYSVQEFENSVQEIYTWVKEQYPAPVCEGLGWDMIWKRMSPGISALFEFKRKSCDELIARLRSELDIFGGKATRLLFTGFGPPMNRSTGLNPSCNNSETVRIQLKSYRFHWGLMVRWYSEELATINCKTSANDWIPFVKNLLEVEDSSSTLTDFTMPEPNEFGPIEFVSECNKVKQIFEDSADKQRVSVRLHGYGPIDLFRNRMQFAKECGYQNISIQRYGYLCDEKISLLQEYVGEGKR
jgi:hypothetical protein